MVKLYELERGSYFKLPWSEELLQLLNIDGMYSRVLTEDNQIIHIAAFTEVVPV
jgi:hypothetical protein